MSRRTLTRTAVLTGLTILLLALATTAVAAPRDPVVSGTVFGSDGVAVPGATIVVNRLNKGVFRPVVTLAANGSGLWTYTDKANTYRFDVSAPNADPASVTLTMAKDGIYTANVTLQAYGAIAGAITASPGGEPLGGATIELYRRNGDGTWPGTPYANALTAADGGYALGILPTGTYAVKASATGYISAFLGGTTIDSATKLVVTRGTTQPASFALAPVPPAGATISGVVVSGAARTPLSGAYVYLYKQNADGTWPPTSPGWGSPTRTVNSIADGTYTSGLLPLGNYRVRFFTTHTGSQWWQYAATVDLATPVLLTYDGETVTGIEGWYGKP